MDSIFQRKPTEDDKIHLLPAWRFLDDAHHLNDTIWSFYRFGYFFVVSLRKMTRYLHIGLALFAALSLLLEVENSAIYALWYEVGNASFTESYCINIDKPELDCAGSCRLSSEMNSIDDVSDNPFQVTRLASDPTNQYFSPTPNMELPSYHFIRRVPFLFSTRQYHYRYVPSVFRPPAFTLLSQVSV